MKNGYQPKENSENAEQDNPPSATTAVVTPLDALRRIVHDVREPGTFEEAYDQFRALAENTLKHEDHNHDYKYCPTCNDQRSKEEIILDSMVDEFSNLMKNKLIKKSQEGFSGWETCQPWELMEMLEEHIAKGDMVDIANYAAMIWYKKQKDKLNGG